MSHSKILHNILNTKHLIVFLLHYRNRAHRRPSPPLPARLSVPCPSRDSSSLRGERNIILDSVYIL